LPMDDAIPGIIKNYKKKFVILLAFSILLTGSVFFLGYFINALYFIGVLPAILPAFISFLFHRKLQALRFKLELREKWGKENARSRDFNEIARLFRYLSNEDFEHYIVDDQTWTDLNLNGIFCKLDRTYSTPGESVLYSILRTPSHKEEELQKRAEIISLLQGDRELREKIQFLLAKLDRQKSNAITELLWGNLPPNNRFFIIYSFLAMIALLSLATPLILGINAFLLITGLFSLNTYIHYRLSREIHPELPAISYLSSLLRTAGSLSKLKQSGVEHYQDRLKKASAATGKILHKTKFLFGETGTSPEDIFLEYLKIFFLLEVRSFYSALREIRKNRDELKEIYLIVGELDALQSIASYRQSLEYYAEPQFVKGAIYLEMQEAIHPLVEKAVSNSIIVKEKNGLLITGSNMSGKSTFLRTVGVNALFAQTICTCLAKKYLGSFFRVISSISKSDDIGEGKSFYFTEAERLLKLILASDFEFPSLCLIDEVLSGTNYLERLAASRAILEYLSRKNALTIVATHDLDLAFWLKDNYLSYHFTNKVDREGLEFNYHIQEGICTSSNAIKLLEYLGYPKTIIERAGQWTSAFDSHNS